MSGAYTDLMDRTFLLVGAVAGLIAVGFGAFGAHGLRGRLSPEMLAVFETAIAKMRVFRVPEFLGAALMLALLATLLRFVSASF